MKKILIVELKKQYKKMLTKSEIKYLNWFVNQLIENSNQAINEKYIPNWVYSYDIEHTENERLDNTIRELIKKGIIENSCDEHYCEFRIAPEYFNLNEPIKSINNENIN